MTNYATLYYLAVTVTVLSVFLGAIQTAGGVQLGLSPQAMAWIAVIASALAVLNGFLPPVQRFPSSKDNAGPASNPDPMPRNT
jgi:hypothetical protein